MDAYEVLGLSRDATAEEVRLAFRRLADLHRPDRQPAGEQDEARVRLQQIHEAKRRALQDIEERGPGRPGPVVVPLQRAGSPTQLPRPAQEVYATAERLLHETVTPSPVRAGALRGRAAVLVPLVLALAAGIALLVGAPSAVVVVLLAVLVLASAVSLWSHGGADSA